MMHRCLSSVGSRIGAKMTSGLGLNYVVSAGYLPGRVTQRILAYLPTSQPEGPSCQQLRDMSSIKARMEASNNALREDKMMCYQCEQTKGGTGCTEIGRT